MTRLRYFLDPVEGPRSNVWTARSFAGLSDELKSWNRTRPSHGDVVIVLELAGDIHSAWVFDGFRSEFVKAPKSNGRDGPKSYQYIGEWQATRPWLNRIVESAGCDPRRVALATVDIARYAISKAPGAEGYGHDDAMAMAERAARGDMAAARYIDESIGQYPIPPADDAERFSARNIASNASTQATIASIVFGLGIGRDRPLAESASSILLSRLAAVRFGVNPIEVDTEIAKIFRKYVPLHVMLCGKMGLKDPLPIPESGSAIRENPSRGRLYVVAPFRYPRAEAATATPQETFVRSIAYGLKTADPPAVRIASAAMAPLVPPGAVLVPVPSSRGSTRENRALAEAIGRLVRAPVVDGLGRESPQSQYALRKGGKASLSASQMRVRWTGPRPSGPVVLIDNVVTTGATAEAARRAIGGDAVILAWADATSGQLGGGEVRPNPSGEKQPVLALSDGKLVYIDRRASSASTAKAGVTACGFTAIGPVVSRMVKHPVILNPYLAWVVPVRPGHVWADHPQAGKIRLMPSENPSRKRR